MRLRLTLFLAAGLLAGACHDKDRDAPRDQMNSAAEQARHAGQSMRAQHRDYDKSRDDLADARIKYTAAAQQRLAQIDADLAQLKARTDVHARMMYADLKVRRDQLAARLDQVNAAAADTWDDFKKGVDDDFTAVEKSLHDALH